MQLIGMLDSPYVRRVAISLQLLELRLQLSKARVQVDDVGGRVEDVRRRPFRI